MRFAGVEMTKPPVAVEVSSVVLVHEEGGLVSWRIESDDGEVIACSPAPRSPLETAARLAGLLDLEATVGYYGERIAKGTLKQADSAEPSRRFYFIHVVD